MKLCSACSAQMEDNAVFCPACGSPNAGKRSGVAEEASGWSPQTSVPVTASEARGFVSSLFDLSFRHFITGKLIKVLYLLGMMTAGLLALVFIGAGFHVNSALGLLALVLSPVAFLLFLAYARVGLEMIMVAFRVEEHLAALRSRTV